MATREIAQGLAGLGRRGDSMLVHMNPEEVAGLQSLARSHGTSLTVNPHTGMPEAFSLGGVFKAALPIAAGFALGPGGLFGASGLFSSALTAGLAVGAGAYALTGDPMYGISAGFGAAGGYGLGSNLAGFGTAAKTPAVAGISEISKLGAQPLLNASTLPGTTGVGAFTNVADDIAASAIPAASKVAAPGLTGIDAAAAGAKKLIEPGGLSSYADYVRSINGSPGMDALTVASPLASGMLQQPTKPLNLLGNMPTNFNYKGPYLPAERQRRMPTPEEQLQLAAAGSPEYTYFSPSNPMPGYTYAQGGTISTGGIRDLYGSVDDQANGAVLSQDGYGLGRLNSMYGGGVPGYAGGGPISFEVGGEIPSVGAVPQLSEAAQASYAVAPTNLAEVAAIKNKAEDANNNPSLPGVLGLAALNQQASQATNDPMGRFGMLGSGKMSFKDMMALRTNPLSNMGLVLPPMARASLGPMYAFMGKDPEAFLAMNPNMANTPFFKHMFPNYGAQPAAPAAPTMQDYIRAANRTPLQAAASPAGTEQQYFNQVNPQPVQAAQGGIMSLAKGGKPSPGGYLDGPGDGMSDSIPATIAGKQPARLADGEFVVPADVVSHLGNGSTKAGAKHLYKMMDKVRQARTGTKKQGRQINPNKFLKA